MKKYNVIIIGGGVIGTAILNELSQQGINNIILLEKETIGSGSTCKSGGFIRCFHQDSYLSDLALESIPTYMDISKEINFSNTGSLFMEKKENIADMRQEIARIQSKGYLLEELTPNQGQKRFPSIDWNNISGAVYEPMAGFANPLAASHYWTTKARESGARVMEGVSVKNIITKDREVVGVTTSYGKFYSDIIIVAAGPWSKRIVKPLGINLKIRTKAIQINFFENKNNQYPCFIDNTTKLYSRPEPGRLSLIGYPIDDWDIDPDVEYPLDKKNLSRVQNIAPTRIKKINYSSFSGGKYGFDAYTSDLRGIINTPPEYPGLIITTGWSGGGFKVAPAVAKKIVNLCLNKIC
jgi:sarcosine oxidase, subunit beta